MKKRATNRSKKNLERDIQSGIIKEIQNRLPGSIILKNDPNYRQGIPDLTILYEDRWAALEVKISPKAHHQPNQDYYVERMNTMSYASFINPQNKEEVLNELQRTLESPREARIPRSK